MARAAATASAEPKPEVVEAVPVTDEEAATLPPAVLEVDGKPVPAGADGVPVLEVEAPPSTISVVGPAVVLVTADGSERYLFRGAVVVEDAFKPESVEHARALGLIK